MVGASYVNTSPGNYILQVALDRCAKPSTSTWTVVSDRRIKDDLGPVDLSRCYEIVKTLPLSRFRYKEEAYTLDQVPDTSRIGWYAQDVQRVFPKAIVSSGWHGLDDCLSINIDQIISSMFGTIQVLQQKVEALEKSNLEKVYSTND